MRIRAIRLKDVGLFREPVAIEGLSGKVDVLAGPNELGKSTIFRAIGAAFLQKHTTTSFAEIRPRTGGDPLIEIDFEAKGQSWRILKRFSESRNRLAELTDLHAGRLEAKGADADERLFELIGRNGRSGGRFELLWIDQNTASIHRELENNEQAALQGAIVAEITAVAGGADLSRVRRRVSELLNENTTPKSRMRAKAHSPYAAALSRRTEVEAALTAARATERAMTASLDELEKHRRRQQELSASAVERSLAEALAAAEQRLEDARRAQTLHSDARAKAADARRARDALAAFDKALVDLAELTTSVQADWIQRNDLAPAANAAKVTARQASIELQHLTEEEQRLQDLYRARAEADAAALRRTQRDAAAQKLARAREIDAAIARCARDLESHPVTADRLGAMDREARAIAVLESRLAAAQPTVRIDYLAGRDGTIQSDGEALPGGHPIKVDDVLVLDIAGVGTISIMSGSGVDRDQDLADLATHRQQLADLLAGTGGADLEAARNAHATRQGLARDLELARVQLAAVAPDGVDALATLVQELDSKPSPKIATDAPPRAAIEASIEFVRGRLAEARRGTEALSKAASDALGQLHKLDGVIDARTRQQQAIAQGLPPASLHGEERTRLATILDRADADAAVAARAAGLLSAAAPTERDIAELAAKRANADKACKQHAEEVHRLARAIERLDGELEESFKSGGGRRVLELEGEFERADAIVRRLEQDLDALRLLATELDSTERDQRDLYLKPVTDQLTPYLAGLFPSADVAFDDKLGPATLRRNGIVEPVSQLSGGTLEQVSVLVRLAFGRLLAESGFPTPVILDDALVYSDDERIERMFHVIEQAGEAHQVIVLTCRSQTFARLGGTRLELAPWRQP